MKKSIRATAAVMSAVVTMSCSCTALAGCSNGSPEDFRVLADMLTLSVMGDDIFAWNAYSATPTKSYGYVRWGEPEWRSYSATSASDVAQSKQVFALYREELEGYDIDDLSGGDKLTYRALENMLSTYSSMYSSQYAADFQLIGGSYISAEGGYVADFATSFENFKFRQKSDVDDLLKVTLSTSTAFRSYLNYARDRAAGGFPLYDYTVVSMQDYLNDVIDKGDDYYLYNVADSMIDGAEFLSESEKATYKSDYKSAIKNNYMEGVKRLAEGLNAYKGNVTTTEKGYLASYGKKGKEYYEFLFRIKTGIKNAKLGSIYNELVDAYSDYTSELDDVIQAVDALENTEKSVYDDFYAYVDGTKLLLDLSDPQEALDYLKVAAKSIVPDLKNEPQITFKEIDETIAERTNVVAYYMSTPLDLVNSPEAITLNPYQIEQDPSDLLITIAHEGYPGHLYSYVKAKEQGVGLLATAIGTSAFSEGWAKYTELALLKHIAEDADKATKLYCEYKYYDTLSRYVLSVIVDMMVNYYGKNVQEISAALGCGEEKARRYVEQMMEDPAVYVPYGYGMYTMVKLHDKARKALGTAYDEVKFNDALLSEGSAPTLTRAEAITNSFISKNKKKK